MEAMEAGKEGRFTAHVPIPTQKDIEEALLRRKKQELLELLAIDASLDEIENEDQVGNFFSLTVVVGRLKKLERLVASLISRLFVDDKGTG